MKKKWRTDLNRFATHIFIINSFKKERSDYFFKLILCPKFTACAIMIATTAKLINVTIIKCFNLNYPLIYLFTDAKIDIIRCVRKHLC